MYVAPGDAVVTSLGAYPTFNFHVAGFGGRLVTVPYENDRESLDGLLAAVRQRARRRWSICPIPTIRWAAGGRRPRSSASSRRLPADHHAGARRGLWRDSGRPRHCRRSMSRGRTSSACAPSPRPTGWPASAAAMRSARPRLIRDFEKIRNHYGVSRMAQIAGVERACRSGLSRSVVARVAAGRDRIAGDRRDERPVADGFGDQFRHHRLRPRWRLRAESAARTCCRATSSSASRWCRCSTAASGSASGSMPNCRCWPRPCRQRSLPQPPRRDRPKRDSADPGLSGCGAQPMPGKASRVFRPELSKKQRLRAKHRFQEELIRSSLQPPAG